MQCCARDAVSDADIEEAAYFSKYAFAAYGYMLYIWSKPQFRWAPQQSISHPIASQTTRLSFGCLVLWDVQALSSCMTCYGARA